MLEIFVLSQVFECTHAFTVPSRYLHHGQHIYKEHLNFPRRKKEIKSFDLLNRVFDGKMHSNAERENEWDIGDDWDRLSSHNVANSNFDTSSIFNVDVASQAAIELEKMMKEEREQEPNGIRCDLADDEATSPTNTHHEHQSVEEADFINNVIDLIQTENLDPKGPALYDTVFHSQNSFNDYTQSLSFTDEMGQEISLLVRCNESPHDLLVEGGRALPVLDDEEKYNISQLLEISQATGTYEPTDFFINSVNSIFQTHARRKINIPNDDGGNNDSNVALDYKGVAAWLSQSLKEKVGQHDKRIPVLMSKYAKYGSGIITREQFQKLYLDAVMIGLDESNKKKEKQNSNFMKMMKLKQATLKEVWRDFESHGIVPPVVAIREELQTKIDAEFGNQSTSKGINALDECEIHEWNSEDNSDDDVTSTSETNEQAGINTKKSSHELVELSSDEKTPKRLRDGEFVFIDEESCIGCYQCTNIAPSAFKMLNNGRARTFHQSNSPDVSIAVSACPVGCMHNVAFHELKEMENARDSGDGHKHHRHMSHNKGHTPLHIARRGGDMNHKSSWYHFLKQKCFMSKACPQRGCYDCPCYEKPGDNPFFKQIHTTAERVRAKDIMDSGEADTWRNIADL